ncbi:hypothetical protein HDU93_009348 [Gonapodya sp. JEL0774]|nr:hypothetical protein HDU93_009348 [Gonapodya sp. JEL0774]
MSTIVTIGHKIQTIIEYDTIVVMSQGKVVEVGTPAELVDVKDGWFAKLVQETGGAQRDPPQMESRQYANADTVSDVAAAAESSVEPEKHQQSLASDIATLLRSVAGSETILAALDFVPVPGLENLWKTGLLMYDLAYGMKNNRHLAIGLAHRISNIIQAINGEVKKSVTTSNAPGGRTACPTSEKKNVRYDPYLSILYTTNLLILEVPMKIQSF